MQWNGGRSSLVWPKPLLCVDKREKKNLLRPEGNNVKCYYNTFFIVVVAVDGAQTAAAPPWLYLDKTWMIFRTADLSYFYISRVCWGVGRWLYYFAKFFGERRKHNNLLVLTLWLHLSHFIAGLLKNDLAVICQSQHYIKSCCNVMFYQSEQQAETCRDLLACMMTSESMMTHASSCKFVWKNVFNV